MYKVLCLSFIITIFYQPNNLLVEAECGKEMTDFFQCFRNLFDLELSLYARGIEFNEFQNHVSKCFVTNGCNDLKLESRKDILKRSNQTNDFPEDTDKAKECKSKIRVQIRNDIEKCVQNRFDKNFRLPEERKTDYVDFPVDVVIRDDIYIKNIISALHNESTCPASSKVTNVTICLGKFFDDLDESKRFCLNPFEEITSRSLGREIACKIDCWKKLGKCSNSLNPTFQLVCECNTNVTNVHDFMSKQSKNILACIPSLNNVTASIVVKDAVRQVGENTCFQGPENPCTNRVSKSAHN